MQLSAEERRRVTPFVRGALSRADALGVIPTPLDQVTEALALVPPEDLFAVEAAPPGLFGKISRLRGRVLGAFAVRERVIYLDRAQPQERVRFVHGHELGHAALPWHHGAYFGDDAYTLSPDTKAVLEAEASSFSSDLLFQMDAFTERADPRPVGLDVPLELAADFEASRHAAIRRYVQEHHAACGLAIFGRFPVHVDGERGLRTLVTMESQTFLERFGPMSAPFPPKMSASNSPLVADARRALRGETADPVLKGEAFISTARGSTDMRYEVFFNGYSVFALVSPKRRVSLGKSARVLWVPAESA